MFIQFYIRSDKFIIEETGGDIIQQPNDIFLFYRNNETT